MLQLQLLRIHLTQDRGEGLTWRYLTTRGHYVMADGRAAFVGESVEDLIKDITLSSAQVAGADSTMAGLE